MMIMPPKRYGSEITLDVVNPTVEVVGSTPAVVNTVYIANGAGLITITLPEMMGVGQTVGIVGKGAGGWKLAQREGQYVRIDERSTTVGVNGYIASTARYDCIEVRCVTANEEFIATSVVGNLTVG